MLSRLRRAQKQVSQVVLWHLIAVSAGLTLCQQLIGGYLSIRTHGFEGFLQLWDRESIHLLRGPQGPDTVTHWDVINHLLDCRIVDVLGNIRCVVGILHWHQCPCADWASAACMGQIKCGVIVRGGSQEPTLILWQWKVRRCVALLSLTSGRKSVKHKTKTFLNLSSETNGGRNCQRVCLTSEKEGFAVVMKPRHLGNSISGICQVKFIDDINLVVLIWSESQSWRREIQVRGCEAACSCWED